MMALLQANFDGQHTTAASPFCGRHQMAHDNAYLARTGVVSGRTAAQQLDRDDVLVVVIRKPIRLWIESARRRPEIIRQFCGIDAGDENACRDYYLRFYEGWGLVNLPNKVWVDYLDVLADTEGFLVDLDDQYNMGRRYSEWQTQVGPPFSEARREMYLGEHEQRKNKKTQAGSVQP